MRLTSWLADAEGLVARIARDLLVRCRELAVQITSLKGSYAAMAASWRPASWPSPAAVLGAAMILSETASATSFRSRHAYARFTGTAPIPLWSGSTVRLIRGGSRTINHFAHDRRHLGPRAPAGPPAAVNISVTPSQRTVRSS